MVILILEDDASTLEAMIEALAEENYTILATGKGKEAVFIAKRRRDIDLFLLDIGLPDLDGWSVAKMIRKWYPNAPIYIFTAWTVMKQFKEAYHVHVDGVYFKPFDLEFLLSVCRRHHPTARSEK